MRDIQTCLLADRTMPTLVVSFVGIMVASPDLLTLAEWSERAAAVLSYFLNLLLIWLILCWTPEKLRDYSRVLLCNCCADVFFTTLSVIVQPVRR